MSEILLFITELFTLLTQIFDVFADLLAILGIAA